MTVILDSDPAPCLLQRQHRYHDVVLVFIRISCDFQDPLPLGMLYLCIHVKHTLSLRNTYMHSYELVIKVVNSGGDELAQSGQKVLQENVFLNVSL